jgi:hypothetical protein
VGGAGGEVVSSGLPLELLTVTALVAAVGGAFLLRRHSRR